MENIFVAQFNFEQLELAGRTPKTIVELIIAKSEEEAKNIASKHWKEKLAFYNRALQGFEIKKPLCNNNKLNKFKCYDRNGDEIIN